MKLQWKMGHVRENWLVIINCGQSGTQRCVCVCSRCVPSPGLLCLVSNAGGCSSVNTCSMSSCIRGSGLLLDLNSCLWLHVLWSNELPFEGCQDCFSWLFPCGTGSVSRYLKLQIYCLFFFNSNLVDQSPPRKHTVHILHQFCASLLNSPSCPGQWFSLHGESQLPSLFLLLALHSTGLLPAVPFSSFPLSLFSAH